MNARALTTLCHSLIDHYKELLRLKECVSWFIFLKAYATTCTLGFGSLFIVFIKYYLRKPKLLIHVSYFISFFFWNIHKDSWIKVFFFIVKHTKLMYKTIWTYVDSKNGFIKTLYGVVDPEEQSFLSRDKNITALVALI